MEKLCGVVRMIGALAIISLLATLCLGASFASDIRIVGGHNATIEDHPYQVALIQDNQLLCGGSLISRNWVLTAAHCLYKPEDITVRLGSVMWEEGGVVHEVKKFHIHPEYKNPAHKKHDYDYALLELKEPAKLNEKVQLLKLAEKGERIFVGTYLRVTGWGDTAGYDGVGPSKFLKYVELPLVDETICTGVYRDKISVRMFCAGFYGEGNKDSCSGDSGGPLVYKGVQYGIVSWGTECALKLYPGVNAKVALERDWIHEVSGV